MPEITLSLPAVMGLFAMFLGVGAGLVFFGLRETGRVVDPTATPTVTRTPTPVPTNLLATPTDSFPTLTPTSTPMPDFVVVSRDSVCESSATSQIRVNVQAVDGSGLPGVDVWITWDGGADRFVTGLKPELGTGFGDFDMQPDVSYRVGAGAQSALALVSGLRAAPCDVALPRLSRGARPPCLAPI